MSQDRRRTPRVKKARTYRTRPMIYVYRKMHRSMPAEIARRRPPKLARRIRKLCGGR